MKHNLFHLLISLSLVLVACSSDPVNTKGTIVGVVKDAVSGANLQNAKVVLDGRSALTGSDGRYQFSDVEMGTYKVSVSRDGYLSDEGSVTVKPGETATLDFSLRQAGPVIEVIPTTLAFGEDKETLGLNIKNTGQATLNWSIVKNSNWFELDQTSGSTVAGQQSSIVVTVKRAGLEPKNYISTFTITSNGGSKDVTVTMTVTDIPLQVRPEQLDFGSISTAQTLTLINNSGTSVSYTLRPSNSWIIPEKTSGLVTYSENINVRVDRSGLSPNDYPGTLRIEVAGRSRDIPVKMTVPDNAAPTVTLSDVTSNVSSNSAVLTGALTSLGSSAVTQHGFCWATTENLDVSSSGKCELGDRAALGNFSYQATSLHPNTLYYVRAYARNSVGITYSNQLSFKTQGAPEPPTVETTTHDRVTSTTAEVSGNILRIGNDAGVIQHGHVWSRNANPTISANQGQTRLGTVASPEPFTSGLTGLSPNVTYHVRAYATNAIGTGYGEDITFTTVPGDIELTTIGADAATLTHNAATLGGSISETGGNDITERGVCWGTTGTPTVEGDHHASADKTNRFMVRITGLTEKTSYVARAYVTAATGQTYYGQVVSFQTTHEIHPATVAKPTVIEITPYTATFRSSITSDGDGNIADCGFVWARTEHPTLETAAHQSCGKQQTGTFEKKVAELAENKTYYVRAYVTNEAGTAYSDEVSFATKEILVPSLSATTVSQITYRSATFAATVTNLNYGTLQDAGFVYSTKETPTLSDNRISCGAVTTLGTRCRDMAPHTDYYVRAYATNERGTNYGSPFKFTTNDDPGPTDIGRIGFDDEKDWDQ